MQNKSKSLPNFSNPPLSEVALSVQFEPLSKFKFTHFGMLSDLYRKRFSEIEEHGLIKPVIEKFDEFSAPRSMIDVKLTSAPQIPRVWFLNKEGSELLQIQPDKFVHNWRKVSEKNVYPRFSRVSEIFFEELEQFQTFLSSHNIGDIVPNQYEVTYVNHITPNGWKSHNDLHKILNIIQPTNKKDYELDFESMRINLSSIIKHPENSSNPVGRLHIGVNPGFSKMDNQPIYAVNLTARGFIKSDVNRVNSNFLNIGHESIVKAFAEITTDEMHKIWGRI